MQPFSVKGFKRLLIQIMMPQLIPAVTPITFPSELQRSVIFSPTNFTGCWDQEQMSFEICCHSRLEFMTKPVDFKPGADIRQGFARQILAILEGKKPLSGNLACFDDTFTFDRCCSINADSGHFAGYEQLFWSLITRWRKLIILQGSVLENWMDHSSVGKQILPNDGTLPTFHMRGIEEGLIWAQAARGALAFAQMSFSFSVKTPRFLEVAAGTGGPSLVALARGFKVWSSDISTGSALMRQLSAKASFGRGSSVLERFFTPTVDLLDETTWHQWPMADDAFSVGGFHIIFLSGPSSLVGSLQSKFCKGYRRLLNKFLFAEGFGLITICAQDLHSVSNGNHSKSFGCLRQDSRFVVLSHRQLPSGKWRTKCVPEDETAFFREEERHFRNCKPKVGNRCLSIFSVHKRLTSDGQLRPNLPCQYRNAA